MADVALIQSYREPILRYLAHMLKDTSAAEDVLQEVWIRAAENVGALRDDGACAAWLYRIATHAAIDHLRSRKRQVPLAPDSDVDEVLAQDEQPVSLAAALERTEMSACVQRFVMKLADEYRAVLFLTEFEGLTGPEIAEALGITLGTAKIRLYRARQQLKELLSGGCCFSRDERGVLVCEPKD